MAIAEDRRNRYRRIANRVRGIPGRRFGLREHQVFAIEVEFSGMHTGAGARTETDVEILESGYPPKVRWLNDEELALAGLGPGAIEIGPITPAYEYPAGFPGGGVEDEALRGTALDVGSIHKIRIVGPKHPSGASYAVIAYAADRALRRMLRARPIDQQEA